MNRIRQKLKRVDPPFAGFHHWTYHFRAPHGKKKGVPIGNGHVDSVVVTSGFGCFGVFLGVFEQKMYFNT